MSQSGYSLFFFPFAGGSKYSLLQLKDELEPDIDVCLLELPGRGSRIDEPLLYTMGDAVEDYCRQVQAHVDEKTIFWGHSFGAVSAYLTILFLKKTGSYLPRFLIVSGSRGIPAEIKSNPTNSLPVNDFWKNIEAYGGVPAELLQYQELKNIFEPILRADFAVLENYVFNEGSLANLPIISFSADNDISEDRKIICWKDFSTDRIQEHIFNGDHFFIFKTLKKIKDIILRRIDFVESTINDIH